MKAQCEVLEDDPPEVVAEKVDRTVEELFGDLEVAPHVRALVGGRSEQRLAREELFDAWRRFAELTRPVDEGRVLLDLANAGVDPEANRARARDLFAACGAEVYLRQVPAGSA